MPSPTPPDQARPSRRRLALPLVLLAACSSPPPAAVAPAGAQQPAPPAAAAPAPLVAEVAAVEPTGAALALAEGTETVIDPAATFRVELSRPCPDARLLLLDGQDALVAASGTQEVGAATKLTLTPSAPLTPAGRYTLRVDGAVQREFHDASGAAHPPFTRAVLVAGSPPPPEPKQQPKKKRRR